jgi:hypothetical protein
MSRLASRLVALSAAALMLTAAPLVASTAVSSAQALQVSGSPASAALTAQNQVHHGVAARPDGIDVFTVGVKCGWWSGTVQWGGLGIPGDPAWIQVTGTVHSSCNSTTYVHIRYTNGLQEYPYFLFAKTGPYSSSQGNYYASTNAGPYGNIWIQACSNRYGWTCASHKA